MKKTSFIVNAAASLLFGFALTASMQSCTSFEDNPVAGEETEQPEEPAEPVVVEGTAAWQIGNEETATLTEGLEDLIAATGVTVGSGLTVDEATYFESTMVKYTPLETNAGVVEDVMIEYTVELAEGATLKLAGISYDAVKVGTDNATYAWSYTVDGVESEIVEIDPKPNLLRNNGANADTAQLNHEETITDEVAQKFTLRFYISKTADNKNICIGNVKINGTVTK